MSSGERSGQYGSGEIEERQDQQQDQQRAKYAIMKTDDIIGLICSVGRNRNLGHFHGAHA
jgi:hypothetical protein